MLIFSLNHNTNLEIGYGFYKEPNAFKYSMHFNFYCNHDVDVLKQLIQNGQEQFHGSILRLDNWIDNIKFLNTLDVKTRFFS